MAPLCADNNNFMAYCMPMASSARSEASLMALAQQLVQHQQQHKQLQHQQQHVQINHQQQPVVPKEPTQAVVNEWASSSSLHNKPEEFALPSGGFYSDDEYDLNPSSDSFFNEPSVLDLSASTLLLPSVESHLQEPVFLYRDTDIRYNDTVDIRENSGVMGLDDRFSDSFANERAIYDGNHGCKFVNPNELSQSFTGADETGELVGFLPLRSGLKPANFQSMAFDSPQATYRADFVFVDAPSSEWMDCLMCDVQPDDADEVPIVSCFDMNPCESTQSSEPAVGTIVQHPCTPEDTLPDGFTVLEEAARCMQSHSDDVSPSWTQDTGNEVLSSPSRDLLSASSPDLISSNALKRSQVEEPRYMGQQGSQVLHDLQQRSQMPCFRQGGRESMLSTDTRACFRSLGEKDPMRKVESYQVPTHGVQLMQLLLECAKTVDSDHERARSVLPKLRALSTKSGDPIQRLGAYFTEALSKRLARSRGDVTTDNQRADEQSTTEELTLAYKAMNDACPYFTFAQLTANQAILEAIEEAEKVHIVDFCITRGEQWAALLQAIASKGGRKPCRVRITGIWGADLAVGINKEAILATGRRLEEFGSLVDLKVEFTAAEVVLKEAELVAEELKIENGEVVAVNFTMVLCNLLGKAANFGGCSSSDGLPDVAVAQILQLAKRLQPKITTLAEMTAGLHSCPFEKRFVNALHFYSAMFDSLEASMRRDCPNRRRMERFLLGDQIDSMVGAPEGLPRRRLQTAQEWKTAMESAGFLTKPLSHYAVSQARILLWRFCDSFTLNEEEGSLALSLGWQNKSLLTVSSWSCS